MASGWTIAAVLSHLGSGAEICTGLVKRGLEGDLSVPTAAETTPVWKRWDALSPFEQRAAWEVSDARHLALLDGLSDAELSSLHVPYFSGRLSVAEYAGYRLSEQAVHAWDIEAALDPAATIPEDELVLLWRRIDLVASRFHSAVTRDRIGPMEIAVRLRRLLRLRGRIPRPGIPVTARPTRPLATTEPSAGEPRVQVAPRLPTGPWVSDGP
jgi:hypothetical protein